jgi:hypothetical protein
MGSLCEENVVGKKLKYLLLLILLNSSRVFGQAVPSAEAPSVPLYVGGEVSTFNPDWDCSSNSPIACWNHQLFGVGVYVDANHVVQKFGAEAEARWLHWRGPGGGFVQSSYLAGPRYKLFQRGKLSFDAKVLVGGGWITLNGDYSGDHGSYFDMVPGATLEYRITRKLTLRTDYEYQIWPSFSGIPSIGNKGLTPNGFSLGASYRVWH